MRRLRKGPTRARYGKKSTLKYFIVVKNDLFLTIVGAQLNRREGETFSSPILKLTLTKPYEPKYKMSILKYKFHEKKAPDTSNFITTMRLVLLKR